MNQKIIQVGNSLAVTIPKSFVDKTGFRAGDILHVQQDIKTKSLIVTIRSNANKMHVSPDLFSWMENIEKKYAPAIAELAKK